MKMLIYPLAISLTLWSCGCATQGLAPQSSPVQTRDSQAAITPPHALELLKEGNRRFAEGRSIRRNLLEQVRATAAGQFPYAAILSCMDSRTSSEIVFDLNTGDAFSIRIAGNIVDEDILGGLEYSTKVAGAKLIAVIGHTECGAIKGAIDQAELGNLTALLSKIRPAVDAAPSSLEPRNSKNKKYVELVAKENVRLVMRQIRDRSPILREMIDGGKVRLVGGMYDVGTGKVSFFEE